MTKDLTHAAEKIEADEMGYTVRLDGDRLHINLGRRYLGYITDADLSGGTGTCGDVQRGGSIAAILRRTA